MKKPLGKFGRAEHENIVTLLRTEVVQKLRYTYPSVSVVAHEWSMALFTGQGKRNQIPDLLFLPSSPFEGESVPLIIEIGECTPCKWDEDLPVIHIGFNGRVTLMNPTKRTFDYTVTETIREMMRSGQYAAS